MIQIKYGGRTLVIPPRMSDDGSTSSYSSRGVFEEVMTTVRQILKLDVDLLYYVSDGGQKIPIFDDERIKLFQSVEFRPVLYVGKQDSSQPQPTATTIATDNMIQELLPVETTAQENNLLDKLNRQLCSMTLSISDLNTRRQNDMQSRKQDQAYRQEFDELNQKHEQLSMLKDRLVEEQVQQQQNNKTLLKEIEKRSEELVRANEEKIQLTNRIKIVRQEITNAREASSKLGSQLQNKINLIQELKVKVDKTALLEEKIDQLQKELDSKNGENLHMNKQLSDICVEKDTHLRRAETLASQLEKEQQERESLQFNYATLQNSSRFDYAPLLPSHDVVFVTPLNTVTANATATNTSNTVTTTAVASSPTNVNPSYHSQNVLNPNVKWLIELEALQKSGFTDQNKNIELMLKYEGDMKQVIESFTPPLHQQQQPKLPIFPEKKERRLPEGINGVDIDVLESMGFHDLDKNIGLLKSHSLEETIDIICGHYY